MPSLIVSSCGLKVSELWKDGRFLIRFGVFAMSVWLLQWEFLKALRRVGPRVGGGGGEVGRERQTHSISSWHVTNNRSPLSACVRNWQ